MMHEILRVETFEGKGPYWGLDIYPDWDPEFHPTPRGDGLDMVKFTSRHYFGFTSEAQFRKWFTPELIVYCCSRAPIQLTLYYVAEEHILHAKSQCAFIYDSAIPIANAPIPWPDEPIQWRGLE